MAYRKYLPILSALFLVPSIASAHAFGQQFSLPLPVSLYILGGVCAFIASSALLFLFGEPNTSSETAPVTVLTFRKPNLVSGILSSLSLLIFFDGLLIAFAGGADYTTNPVVTLFWVWLMLGFFYASAIIGGLGDLINPFRVLAGVLFKENGSALFPYPARFGYWPSVLGFFGLIWVELFSGGFGGLPRELGVLLIGYTVWCLVGSSLFGTRAWFTYADFFSVYFRMISLLAPLQVTQAGITKTTPGFHTVSEHPERLSLVIFILLMLSATAVDGLKETVPWWSFLLSLNYIGITFSPTTLGVIALLLSPFVFFMYYVAAVAGIGILTKETRPFRTLLLDFAYPLIPITLAYNFAHYFTLLLGDGQYLFAQISDPLARGWNLFGTAHHQPNYLLLGADTIWYIQLFAIVAGHIVAAVLAHQRAARIFGTRKDVNLSQIPMLILMVGYTAFGLWILSLPFTN